MHIPSDLQKVNAIAERLAGSIHEIRLTHVFRAARECRPNDPAGAAALLELAYERAIHDRAAWALRAQKFD
jgi:hypothetical protein